MVDSTSFLIVPAWFPFFALGFLVSLLCVTNLFLFLLFLNGFLVVLFFSCIDPSPPFTCTTHIHPLHFPHTSFTRRTFFSRIRAEALDRVSAYLTATSYRTQTHQKTLRYVTSSNTYTTSTVSFFVGSQECVLRVSSEGDGEALRIGEELLPRSFLC